MTDLPAAAALFAALDATWPAEITHRVGPWLVRQGQGAGNRVATTTAVAPVTAADITTAEARHQELGQPSLFMIRPGDEELDALLAARGYRHHAPAVLQIAPTRVFSPPSPLSGFALWPPLAIIRAIWDEGGINAARQAVMDRAKGPVTAVLARPKGGTARPTGAAFVAVAGDIAMIHAIVVRPFARRQGCGHTIMTTAAAWAHEQGARWLALAVTAENVPAAALYSAFDMTVAARYHYRLR